MQNNKTKINKEKAKAFGRQMVQKINQLIRQHNQKVRKLNIDAEKQNKINKVVVNKADSKLQEQFYTYSEDTAQKLKLMNSKLAESQRIKKQRRDIFINKIGLMISSIQDLAENKKMKVFIDPYLIKWVKQLGDFADQASKNLAFLQKESKGFCFGGNKNNYYNVQKGLVNLIGYSQIWKFLQTAQPQIQRETQNRYIELDYNESIFFDIEYS